MHTIARRTSPVCLLLFATFSLSLARGKEFAWLDEDQAEFAHEFHSEDVDSIAPVSAFAMGTGGRGCGQDRVSCGSRCGERNCFRSRETLFGDGWGCRTRLQESGITYRGRLTQFFFGVADGIQEPVPAPFGALGIKSGDRFEYTGNSQHDLLFDLEELGGPKAGRFLVTLENIWGRFGNVSLESGATAPPVFNAFFPIDPAANGAVRVTNFLYVQPLSEGLILSAGKTRLVGTADRNIFAGGDGSDQFLNQTFIANPLVIQQLVLSTFSVGAVMPRKWGRIAIRVIDTKERSTEFFDLGDLFADGMVLLGQIRVKTNFFGKPGEHHIGLNYKHSDLLDLRFIAAPPSYPYPPAPPGTPGLLTKSDLYTISYGFDQYIDVFGEPDARGEAPGWGFFGRAGISDGGSGNPNFKAWHISGGIGGDSLLQNRRDKGDRFGLAYGFTATSDEWGPTPRAAFGPRDSQAIEVYYRYHATPAISITPDIQWVKGSLGGLTGGDDAFIYGVRLNMRL